MHIRTYMSACVYICVHVKDVRPIYVHTYVVVIFCISEYTASGNYYNMYCQDFSYFHTKKDSSNPLQPVDT